MSDDTTQQTSEDQALLAACLARHPDLARYAATARVETMTLYDNEAGDWLTAPCVTVTVLDKAHHD